MHTLDDARAVKFMDGLPHFCPVSRSKYQLRLSGARHLHLRCLVHIAVRMTGNGDGLLPGAHRGLNAFHHDRCTKNSAVQNGADRSIGALPHFLQIIFCHTGSVGGDGGTFNCNTVFFRCQRGIHRHLIVGLIAVLQTQIIILCFQINIRQQQLVLDDFPQDTGHLISVHFHKRGGHCNLVHKSKSSCFI